ncbi:glycosyl transferase group 1 [Spirochaeta thermophila DSM 6578]|uniref:Glycosyl transferase group 1 n=1 Tax=Winmispira thermophila (strain ATCC 700085 / DSM 6578 / Z-1203) TaxID=869211 RepID=G0GAX8_WINT7|nr:glycosyltransferase family 4 protein [Spirochaeta thermophila]AEJ61874.1 glycosyl transferase group 1 [Spirochaeta thermophila DSM 6578]
MHIVYVLTRSDTRGGVQVHVRDLCKALMALGHRCTVLVGGRGIFLDELAECGIPYVVIPSLKRSISPFKDLEAFLRIRKVLKDLRPDLVSTHTSKAGVLGRLAARSLDIPVVFTAHGWAFTEGVPPASRWIYRVVERIVAPCARKIITVSEFDREIALKGKVGNPSQLVAIHNGMPDIPVELHARPEVLPPRMVMLARFEPQKDHRTLFLALSKLRHMEWHMECVGDGPLLGEMKRLASSLGLGEKISFHGFRSDVETILSRAQIYVLVTHWEGFPRSILEAMRAGLPVVASRVGGVEEAVQDGVTGYVVGRGDMHTLADRLERLIADPRLRASMGRAGRARYETHFTFERMLNETLDLYQHVLEEERRS